MNGADQRVLSIIGAPIEDGTSVPGTVMGPAALRTAGLIRTLRELGHEVEDHGDLRLEERGPEPALAAGSARNIASVAGWARLLRRATYTAMKNGRVPIVLGGDHSLSIGSVSGVLQYCAEAGRAPFVLWLDAHADFNTPATSPSGNLHGMSAAWLCGEPGLPLLDDAPRQRSIRRTCICSACAPSTAASASCCMRAASTSSTCAGSTSSARRC